MTFGVAAVSMRTYFSAYHLWGAKHFATLARSIEDAHKGPPRFSIRHRAYVTNSILSSVAFLEALINEFFDDAYLKNLTDKQREKLAALWKLTSTERASILDKVQIAVVAVEAAPFDMGAAPFQDAAALVKLRNELVHARAETRDSQDQKASGAWQTRFPPNGLMRNAANPYVFDHLLGAGCADWAVRSALALADAFLERTGANSNYKMADFQDN